MENTYRVVQEQVRSCSGSAISCLVICGYLFLPSIDVIVQRHGLPRPIVSPLTMFRLGTLRPLLQTTAPRIPSRNAFAVRPLSTLRSQGQFMKTNWRPRVLWQSSRTYTTESPIVQQAQGFSWQRVAIGAVSFCFIIVKVLKLTRHHVRRQQ